MDAVRAGKVAALASTSVLLLASSAVVVQVAEQLHRTPLLTLKAESTLDYAGRAAKHVDEAAGVWAEASRTETAYLNDTLPALTAQVDDTLQASTSFLQSLHHASDNASDALLQAQVVEADADKHLVQVLDAAKSTLDTTQQTIADPHIRQSLDHIDAATAAGADSLKQVDGILTDARTVADKYQKRRPWLARIFGF